MRGTQSPKVIISRMTNPEVLKFRSRALRALRGEAQPTTKRSRPTQAHGHARRAWLPLRNMLTRRLVLILAFAPPAASHNGYSFSVSGGTQMAGTRVSVLNSSDPEIAKFANGLSMTIWARFNDLSPTRKQMPISINTHQEDNFFQGFAGMDGGWMFGGAAPQIVSTLGDNASDWHHYAFTWDYSEAKFYVNGALETTLPQTELSDWWDQQAYIVVGASGYNDR